jgi:hypothetical protein
MVIVAAPGASPGIEAGREAGLESVFGATCSIGLLGEVGIDRIVLL